MESKLLKLRDADPGTATDLADLMDDVWLTLSDDDHAWLDAREGEEG